MFLVLRRPVPRNRIRNLQLRKQAVHLLANPISMGLQNSSKILPKLYSKKYTKYVFLNSRRQGDMRNCATCNKCARSKSGVGNLFNTRAISKNVMFTGGLTADKAASSRPQSPVFFFHQKSMKTKNKGLHVHRIGTQK